MSDFYLLSDQAVVGPFTGIELREAALAGVLHSDCVVGSSGQGPWYSAVQIGLFSESNVPLPHPPGIGLPRYDVDTAVGSDQGPFKLRELIGLAAHGLLSPDARIRAESGDQWSSVRRFRILTATMDGDLVLVDQGGRIHRRTQGVLEGADASRWDDAFRAPIQLARRVEPADSLESPREPIPRSLERKRAFDDGRSDQKFRDRKFGDQGPSDQGPSGQGSSDQGSSDREVRPEGESTPMSTSANRWEVWQWDHDDTKSNPRRLAKKRRGEAGDRVARSFQFPRRSLVMAASLMILMTAIGVAAARYPASVMSPDQVRGQWIAMAEDGESPRFGIAFEDNGHCTIFNVGGESWSGRYAWNERHDDDGATPFPDMRSVVDRLEPHHQSAPVDPSDGYVQLLGFASRPPTIDGHRVQDLFVRRDGDQLRLGYLTVVEWSGGQKRLTAGWMNARRRDGDSSGDVLEQLKHSNHDAPSTDARITHDHAIADGPSLAEAIAIADQVLRSRGIETAPGANRSQIPASVGTWGESPVGPASIHAASLLERFGVPDEARRIFRFERPQDSAIDTQHWVRYGNLVLLLSAQGRVAYVRVIPVGAGQSTRT